MAETSIEWTDKVWNPVRGCTRVSPGCQNCYAETTANRFSGPGMPYEGLVHLVGDEPRWTGKIRLVPEKLDEPLHWRKPARVFVNSMSDLFHESVPDEFIDQVFAVMGRCQRHTFQLLTKRAERMREYCSRPHQWVNLSPNAIPTRRIFFRLSDAPQHECCYPSKLSCLPNCWLGVSVEDQQRADERIPLLLQTPAAVRFLSIEPLLGAVDIEPYLWAAGGSTAGPWHYPSGRIEGASGVGGQTVSAKRACELHWIIIGGESGPGARPCHVEWIRSIVKQCQDAGTPAFVKQLGSYATDTVREIVDARALYRRLKLNDSKGGNMLEWPDDLRVRQFPQEATHE